MQIGSIEHKASMLQTILATYQENIWKDEMILSEYESKRALKQKEVEEIQGKIDRKEYKPIRTGEKAKFVAGRELVQIDKDITTLKQAIELTWPTKMQFTRDYAKTQGIEIE